MKLSLLLLVFIACSQMKSREMEEAIFPENVTGCYLLFNMKTDSLLKKSGTECQKRFPPASTFKVPLSVIAFDTGVLKDEKQVLKWDGTKRMLDAWNQDQDARSWMKESVVWFSQRLTPKMGKVKAETYLSKFNYGNADLSSGLTDAWLHPPGNKNGNLEISPIEQLEFMKRLWTSQLPVKMRSMDLTKEIMYLETSPNGYKLSGKTGSNFFDREKNIQLGWFIAHVTNGTDEYLSVVMISDLKPYPKNGFGGLRAKELTKSLLAKENLW